MPYFKRFITCLAASAVLTSISASSTHATETSSLAPEHPDVLQQTHSFITLSDETLLWAGFSGYDTYKRWLIGRLEANSENEFVSIIDPPSTKPGAYTTAKYLVVDEPNQYVYVIGVGSKNEHWLTRLSLSDLAVDYQFGRGGFVSLYPDLISIDGFVLEDNSLFISGKNLQEQLQIRRFNSHGDAEFHNIAALKLWR